jgi:hypothetical protein
MLAALSRSTAVLAISLSSVVLAGCERKEKVLDVNAPGVQLEVERNLDTGQVDVKVNNDQRSSAPRGDR